MVDALEKHNSFTLKLDLKKAKILIALLTNLNNVRASRAPQGSFSNRLDFLGLVIVGFLLTIRVFLFHSNLFHLLGFTAVPLTFTAKPSD